MGMTNPEAQDLAGKWRYSFFDGRFVFDHADGQRVGFVSNRYMEPWEFADYVTALEAQVTAQAEALRVAREASAEAVAD